MKRGRSSQRLDLEGIPTSKRVFKRALKIVDRSGSVQLLAFALIHDSGAPRRSDLKGFLVACAVNALRSEHTGEIVSIARVMNGFTGRQRRAAEIVGWDREHSYDRVDRLFNDLAALDGGGVVGRDPALLHGLMRIVANRIVDASIPTRYRMSNAVAVDGTDLETWGRARFRDSQLELDGYPGPSDEEAAHRASQRWVPVPFGIGPDGRKIWTKDPDARAGHRSATNSRPAGPFTGYECHAIVQTREATIRNPVDGVVLGPKVPPLIRAFYLTEAGAHRPRVCRDLIEQAESAAWPIGDVIADRGMTSGVDEWQLPLRAQGKRPFFDLTKNQRGLQPSRHGFVLVDGWPHSRLLPQHLVHDAGGKALPVPPRGASEAQRAELQARFAERRPYQFSVHSRPDKDGAIRLRGPLSSRRLRNEQYPDTMRERPSKPLVILPTDWDHRSDDGTVTVQAADMPLFQCVAYGAPAWHDTYTSRRQVVESAFAGLREAGASIGTRGHFKVFGISKLTLLMAFEIVAYNLRRIDAFERELAMAHAAPRDAPPKTRAKRRLGTHDQILEQAKALIGADRLSRREPRPPP